MSDDILEGLSELGNRVNQKSENSGKAILHEIGDTFLLPLDSIKVEPQVRSQFNNIEELAESIKNEGQRLPLEVASLDDSTFLLITGGRRYQAMQKIGVTQAKVTLIKMPANQANRIASQLTENIQRDDLSALELAEAFNELTTLGWSQGKIATSLNKSRPWVNRYCVLYNYPEPVKKLLQDGITSDITLVGTLASIYELDPESFSLLAKRLESESLTRAQAKAHLDSLTNNNKNEEKEKLPTNQQELVSHEAYHLERPFRMIRPDTFTAKVKAKLVNGDYVTGTLQLDRYVQDNNSMVWILTDEKEKVAVDITSLRIISVDI